MLNRNNYQRQLGLVDTNDIQMPISIVGAGGIGSWTVLALAKMGCQDIMVCDYDTVGEENIGSQLYTTSDIDKKKVEALKDRLMSLTDVVIKTQEGVFTEFDFDTSKILIAAVDNMITRRDLFNSYRKQDIVFIDGRMGGNEINIFAFNLSDEKACAKYEKFLFTDEEADEIRCSERAVMYNTFVCGGLIASLVARIGNNQPYPFEQYIDLKNYDLFKTIV